MNYDDIPTDVLDEMYRERKRLARLHHWCDLCHGHTGPGSPCHQEEERETIWVCTYCGADVGSQEPATFMCCGEIGHVQEVYEDTGEPVNSK